MNDLSYWKTEEVKHQVKVGEKCKYSQQTLLIKGAEKYDECMESKFDGNKLQKFGMMALTSIYSLGTLPTAHVIKHAREIEKDNMEDVTAIETEIITRPPTVEEMIPVAREIVRKEVRNEFAEFLRKKAAGNP